jgi:putative SOS response-associated peptidase YedK
VSRLFTVMASIQDVAVQFQADRLSTLTVPAQTIEGDPGLVVIEREGRRVLRSMTWGFPRLNAEMRDRGEPPGLIGLVADLTNSLWNKVVVDPRCRCLIPLTHFANPEGVPKKKTRTWFSVKDRPIVAWTGFRRNTREFSTVFAGMTMEANEAILPTNDRMPVLLEPHDYDRWQHGSIEDVIGFQFRPPVAAERMEITRTNDLWRSGLLPIQPRLSLL